MKIAPGKLEILIFAVIIIAALFLVFRPVAITRENSIAFNAMVYKVGEGSGQNVIFRFNKGSGIYYISHGLRKGLNLDTLKKKLVNREVTVLYLKPGFASGFSPVANTKYITELRLDDRIIYSELGR